MLSGDHVDDHIEQWFLTDVPRAGCMCAATNVVHAYCVIIKTINFPVANLSAS